MLLVNVPPGWVKIYQGKPEICVKIGEKRDLLSTGLVCSEKGHLGKKRGGMGRGTLAGHPSNRYLLELIRSIRPH